jgi:1-deoxy-D-xylulose-5-phosphate reductoisomerase
MKKRVAILGSTGSIGKCIINIIKKDKKNFEILFLAANSNYKELLKQAKIFNVKNILIADKKVFEDVSSKYQKVTKINFHNNYTSLNKIFKGKKIDYAMSAITGLNGLAPTLKIIKFTKNIAIANKEAIICGWNLIHRNLKIYKTKFMPVDSEHFSIWSLLDEKKKNDLERVFITASGGPFHNYPLNKFKFITPKLALKHPNWKMGQKITIDSSTMMNKVFEIIEAKKIFNLKYDKLSILLHTESYIHAIVKFNNGLTKLLIHDTNMTIPIFNSLYPNNEKNIKSKNLDLGIINNLKLQSIDQKRFPVTKILKLLPDKHSLFETIIVTANDKLVNLFLDKKINYLDISKFLLKIISDKEFKKYKLIRPRNIDQIKKLSDYVSLKIDLLSI